MASEHQFVGGAEPLTVTIELATSINEMGRCALIGRSVTGAGVAHVNDLAVAGDRELDVVGFESISAEGRSPLDELTARDSPVGVLVGWVQRPEALQGAEMRFASRPSTGRPALVDGSVVTDQALLVRLRGRQPHRDELGVLIVDGWRIRLLTQTEETLVDAPGDRLTAGPLDESTVGLRGEDGVLHRLHRVERLTRRDKGAVELRDRYHLAQFPTTLEPERLAKRRVDIVAPSLRPLRASNEWARALVTVLQTRAVGPLADGD